MKKHILYLFIFSTTAAYLYSQPQVSSEHNKRPVFPEINLLFFESLAYADVKDSGYVRQAVASGIQISSVKRYHDLGINLSKLNQYKQIGLDLPCMSWGVSDAYTPEAAILYSENIVMGKISRAEFNSDSNARFHSTYTVRVKNTLKGKLTDTAVIKSSSGLFVVIADDEILQQGQNVLLFTNPWSPVLKKEADFYATAAKEEKEMYLRNIVELQSVNGNEQHILKSYIVSQGKLYHYGNQERLNLTQVKDMVKKFVAIQNSPSSN